MPSAVTAYFLRIASPGDTAIEMVIAREVVSNWNASNTLKDSLVLVSRSQGEPATPELDDLLVAFFTTTPGPHTPAEVKKTEALIEAYLAARRPVLIYLSEARADFDAARDFSANELEDLKQRYAERATIDSFRDEKEFRSRFAQQLEATVRGHHHFQGGADGSCTCAAAAESAPFIVPEKRSISELAKQLLCEACEDTEAYFGRFRNGPVLKIQVNGHQLVEQGQPGAVEEWEAAIQELLDSHYIRDVGGHGRLFQISPEGFTALKAFGKFPVGYIAELGGM